MNIRSFINLVVLHALIFQSSLGFAADNCGQHFAGAITEEKAYAQLEDIDRDYQSLPQDILTAIKHGLMPETEFTRYTDAMKKYYFTPKNQFQEFFSPVTKKYWDILEALKVHRLISANKQMSLEYSSNIGASLVARMVMYKNELMRGTISPQFTSEAIIGSIVNIFIVTYFLKTPTYRQLLKENNLLAIEELRNKWIISNNQVMQKAQLLISKTTKRLKNLDKISDRMIDFMIDNKMAQAFHMNPLFQKCSRDFLKEHSRGLLKMMMLYFAAGVTSGYIHQSFSEKTMSLEGESIQEPFEGYTPWLQGFFLMLFGANGYFRFASIKKGVIPFFENKWKNNISNDQAQKMYSSEGKSIDACEISWDHNKLYQNRVKILTLTVFMANTLYAAFAYKHYRESGFKTYYLIPGVAEISLLLEGLKQDSEEILNLN